MWLPCGAPKRSKGSNQFPALIGIPNIENAEEDYLRAMRIFGKKWKLGSLADGGPHVELLRCGFYKLSILCQHLLGLIERVKRSTHPGFQDLFHEA